MMQGTCQVWFHGGCSKCRGLREILDARGLEPEYRIYHENPPSVDELESILVALGELDPMVLVRVKDPCYEELGLEGASRETLLEALVENASLLQRPILVMGGRAVVARPPERALEILES